MFIVHFNLNWIPNTYLLEILEVMFMDSHFLDQKISN